MTLDEGEERGRGVLSPVDREYLAAPEDYIEEKSRQAAHERKEAIRQRVRDSVLDLALLFDDLPAGLRKEVFGMHGYVGDVDLETLREEEIENALVNAVAFLYLGGRDGALHPPDLVEEAIRRGEERGRPDAVEVDIEIDHQRLTHLADRAREKIDNGEPLTNAEIRAALEVGVPGASPDDLAEYLRRNR